MGLFSRDRQRLETVMLNCQLNNLAAASITSFTLYRTMALEAIYITANITAIGTLTFGFRDRDTNQQPFISGASGPFGLQRITFNSYLGGINTFKLVSPLHVDYIQVVNANAIAIGTFVDIAFSLRPLQ